MLLNLSTPSGNKRSPAHMAQVLAAILNANTRRHPLSLILAAHRGTVGFYVRYPPELRSIVEGHLADNYHDSKITRLSPPAFHRPLEHVLYTGHIRLRPDVFALKDPGDFEDRLKRTIVDPITGLLSALKPSTKSTFPSQIEITIRPAKRLRIRARERIVRRLSMPFLLAHPLLSMPLARTFTSHRLPVRWLAQVISFLLPSHSKRLANTAMVDFLDSAAEKCSGPLFEGMGVNS